MEKTVTHFAKELLDYLLDEVPCVFTDIGDLDPIEDYVETKEKLGTQVEREWYDLWQNIYENLEEFIGHYEEH